MDVKAEMLAVRRKRYDSNRDLAATVDGYMDILNKARQDPSVQYGEISVCLSSIAMVLHEANRLPEAIAVYRKLSARRMHPEMKARIFQNLGVALVANHQYEDAVQATEEALKYAWEAYIPQLIDHLETNLETVRKHAADKPKKVIILGLKTKVSDQDLEKKLKDWGL